MTIDQESSGNESCEKIELYRLEKSKSVINQHPSENSVNLRVWMVRAHFGAYRAVCNQITGLGLFVINRVIKPEKSFSDYEEFGTYLRKFAPIDYTCVTGRRMANKVSQVLVDQELYSPEELKTNNQQLKEREIKEMSLKLGEDSAYTNFCKDTALLVDELFPKLVCAQMIGLPRLVEQSFMYTLWLPYRYINYQINRRKDYRQKMIDSDAFKTMERLYWYVTTNFTHSLLCKENVSPILNFEHVLLQLCMKLKPKVEEKNKGTSLTDVILRSVSKSIERLQACDEYLNGLKFDSKREAFIERLEWYRVKGYLPLGTPNPSVDRLNVSNLEDELDRAMYEYLDQISTKILDELVPKKFKNHFVHFVYWLEGKNGLVKLFSYLLGELAVKQVSDPHLFALSILSGLGIETADFELYGFGRGKMETIFKAGEKMIKHSLEENVSSSVVVEDFLNTELKSNPQSVEENKQKKEARENLEKVICQILYDGIKPESYRHSGGLKDVRKFMQKIPIVGLVTMIMNTMYSTLHLSISYYFRKKEQYDDSLSTYWLKNMWGQDYTKTLTERTMELLYHPAWRLLALQLIHDVTNHIFNRGGEVHRLDKEPSTNDNIRSIASFMINHYTKGLSVPIEPIFSSFLSDETIDSIKKSFSSPEKPFLETAIESILPTINEITLYLKVGQGFRKESVYFEGDAKFWELYIREYLNRAVELKVSERYSIAEVPSVETRARIRDELVRELLNIEDMVGVRKKLISLPKKVDKHQDPVTKIEKELNRSVIWEYGEPVQAEENKTEDSEYTLSDDFVVISDGEGDPFTRK